MSCMCDKDSWLHAQLASGESSDPSVLCNNKLAVKLTCISGPMHAA